MKNQKVDKVYVGVFEISDGNGGQIETILAGVINGEFRATIEHNKNAVPNLIEMCNVISTQHGLKWRLLKFDKPDEVELDEFNNINMSNLVGYNGVFWNKGDI